MRLGINIDHVATIRNARGGEHPDPVYAAKIAINAGADGITAHLREDRRHIIDSDVERIKREVNAPLNLEMAVTTEMLKIALKIKPNAVCLVPERRQELTTEGGLDVISGKKKLKPFIAKLKKAKIRVSLFVDPDISQLDASKEVGADIVELHTGSYCHSSGAKRKAELGRIRVAAEYTKKIGLECHAGHGLNYDNVKDIAAIKIIQELNIGHHLMGEAIFVGIAEAVKKMRKIMDSAK